VPLAVRMPGTPCPPRGAGNAASLIPSTVSNFAAETATYLRNLEQYFGVRISGIAIDAPSGPRASDLKRRRAEQALDERGISCFATPSAKEFAEIRRKAAAHLSAGGSESQLPHANQLWMLVGFALFKRLRKDWECLEVFPQATVHALGASAIHKSKPGGVLAQLKAIAQRTGWPEPISECSLKLAAYGPAHDALDAYMSAWVAGLPSEERAALGVPPDDAIWIPLVSPKSHPGILSLSARASSL